SAELHVLSRVDHRAELADQDAAGVNRLAGVDLHTSPLAGGVAPVPRRPLSLLMSHFAAPSSNRNRSHLHFCKGMAMPAPSSPTLLLLSEVQPTPMLPLCQNLTNHLRAGEYRAPHFGFARASDQEHLLESDLGAYVSGNLFDPKDVAFSNSILF